MVGRKAFILFPLWRVRDATWQAITARHVCRGNGGRRSANGGGPDEGKESVVLNFLCVGLEGTGKRSPTCSTASRHADLLLSPSIRI